MLRVAVLAGAFLLSAALRQRDGRRQEAAVAGIVAVHPPKFDYLLDFFEQWAGCVEGRDVVDFYVVFSNSNDSHAFAEEWRARGIGADGPWEALIAQNMQGKKPSSWKKLDGLAQLLDMAPQRGYEFALLMDAEIGLNSCRGFKSLLDRLRAKHDAKAWFGDNNDDKDDATHQHMRFAACAVSPEQPRDQLWREVDPVKIKCGTRGILQRIQQQTKDFSVNTWWTDIPYVHMETARRMFRSWAATLGDVGAPSTLASTASSGASFSAMARRYVRWLPSPSDVSSRMGAGYSKSQSVRNAAVGFEHLIYQFYTVVHEGFVIQDLTDKLSDHLGHPLNERFCKMSEGDRQLFLDTVRPLWLVAGCPCYTTKSGPPLLLFHLDRRKASDAPNDGQAAANSIYCSPEMAAKLGI